MTDREQLWMTLLDRAKSDDAVAELIKALKVIEDVISDDHEFDAPKLKLPYADKDHEQVSWSDSCEAAP